MTHEKGKEILPAMRNSRIEVKPLNRGNNWGQVLALGLMGAGLVLLGVFALLLLLKQGKAAYQAPDAAEENLSAVPATVDFPAPELSLVNLKGERVALSDYETLGKTEGQVVLVNNWAIWCPPCKAEMPVLDAYYQAHREKGFTVIAIEAGEPVHEVATFVEENGLSFPVWPDPTVKALDAFRNDRLPNSYVVDRTGQVRLAWTGAINLEMLEKYVTPLLEQEAWIQK